MTATRRDTTAPGRLVLSGLAPAGFQQICVELGRETERQKAAARGSDLDRLLACAADPSFYILGQRVDDWTDEHRGPGGRPRDYPTAVMLIFGSAAYIFDSQSKAERTLRNPIVWRELSAIITRMRGPDTELPAHGPTRDHYFYFTRRVTDHMRKLLDGFAETSAAMARSMGLADPATASLTNPDRTHTAAVDGKVFNSPQAHNKAHRIDRKTGEIRPIRQDPARGLHREGGSDDAAIGTKAAFMTVRSPLSGHRVIVGLDIVPAGKGHSEADYFADLAITTCSNLPGVVAITGDGAFRGKTIDIIQTQTGAIVVSPPRTRTKARGGVKLIDKHYQARTLPERPAHRRAFANCAGHDLWTAGGAVLERVITADGTSQYEGLQHGQVRSQRKKDGNYTKWLQLRLPCRHDGGQTIHTWNEPLTPVADDARTGFNRGEHLRAIPRNDRAYSHAYGRRADAESLHAELEHSWHRNRLPAWGGPRQTALILGAAMAHNAWALERWKQEAAQQHPPPATAA